MNNATYSPFLRRYVMAKPTGSRCNLGCAYCYYLAAAEVAAPTVMTDAVLEAYIRQYIALSPDGEEVSFCWHGGEPLLLPRSFYERALLLQRKYADGHPITNVIQTNGTLLTDEWCEFLAENQFLVGVSLDGDEACHDRYRRTRGGKGSFKEVMRGVERLNRYAVDYNILAVINGYTAQRPLEVYRFLRSVGSPYMQFAPDVERDASGVLRETTVSAEAFGQFYCTIFDEWYAHDTGRVFVELFDTTLALLMGYAPPACIFGETCGNAAVLEANGDLYCCDHFVSKAACLGNIMTDSLWNMLYSPAMQAFGEQKAELPSRCKACEYVRLCNGECPKNRFYAGDGEKSAVGEKDREKTEPPTNYLCEGYRMYFEHTLPYFKQMKAYIEQQGWA